jgi:hypothetical protein
MALALIIAIRYLSWGNWLVLVMKKKSASRKSGRGVAYGTPVKAFTRTNAGV